MRSSTEVDQSHLLPPLHPVQSLGQEETGQRHTGAVQHKIMQFDICVWFNNTDEFSQAHAMAAVFSVTAPPDNKNTAH